MENQGGGCETVKSNRILLAVPLLSKYRLRTAEDSSNDMVTFNLFQNSDLVLAKTRNVSCTPGSLDDDTLHGLLDPKKKLALHCSLSRRATRTYERTS